MPERTRLQPASLQDPVRYSLGWKAGNTVYLAGAIGSNDDGSISPDFKTQARRAWQKLEIVMKEAGGSLQNIVKTTVFITDMRYQQAHGEVRAEVLPGSSPPASTLIQCVALAQPGALIEIEAVAILD